MSAPVRWQDARKRKAEDRLSGVCVGEVRGQGTSGRELKG